MRRAPFRLSATEYDAVRAAAPPAAASSLLPRPTTREAHPIGPCPMCRSRCGVSRASGARTTPGGVGAARRHLRRAATMIGNHRAHDLHIAHDRRSSCMVEAITTGFRQCLVLARLFARWIAGRPSGRRLQSADARPPPCDDHRRRPCGAGCVHRRGSGDGERRGARRRTGQRVRVDGYDGVHGRARFHQCRRGGDCREHGTRSLAGAHVRVGAHADICCGAVDFDVVEHDVTGAHGDTRIDRDADCDAACANRGGLVDHTRLDRHACSHRPTDDVRETARAGCQRRGCPLGHQVSDLPERQRLALGHFEASARQTGCRMARVDGRREPHTAP